jgi:hypothetical protein
MQFETLYRELAHSLEIVPRLAGGVTQAEAAIRPGPDSWSMLEVVCHLYDEEREDFRQRLDVILHRPQEPLPPIDPQGWVAARNYNQQDLAEMLDKWAAERQRSLEWLQSLVAPDWDAEYPTPFGVFKAGDMLSAWVAHDNLHTRQLVELRRSRIVQITAPYDVRYAGDW